MSHDRKMLLGCLLSLAMIFIFPGLGLGPGIGLLLLIVLILTCHLTVKAHTRKEAPP